MTRWFVLLLLVLSGSPLEAGRPVSAYIFPAGGRRGTTVDVKIGGHNFHEQARFHLRGPGVAAPEDIARTETRWFEGPLIPMPASQRKEDYPKDYAGRIEIDAGAPLGVRYWNVTTSQGIAGTRKFIVGDLPEVVENEIDGDPLPTRVELPVTINGRVFPRQDVDVWTFAAQAGRPVTCEVCAARLGSPLDSRLEVRDPDGRPLAENVDALGTDSRVRFTPETDGVYQVRIHDVSFGGLQDYVYRLTITGGPCLDSVFPLGGRRGSTVKIELDGPGMPAEPVSVALPESADDFAFRWTGGEFATNAIALQVDDLPERLESEDIADPFSEPVVLNGRIAEPGETDRWTLTGKKGDHWGFEVWANRLGSPLDGVLTLKDAAGKTIGTADDLGKGVVDPRLGATLPADGAYTLEIRDRLASRGGLQYAYRLRADHGRTELRAFAASDTVTIDRGGSTKLKVSVERPRGYDGEIELRFDGLPEGVSVKDAAVKAKKNDATLVLEAGDEAPIAVAEATLRAKAVVGDRAVEVPVTVRTPRGEPVIDRFQVAVAMPTPFKFVGTFETRYSPRGSLYTRHYQLERNGFEGPLEIRLADQQVRHLQGVTGEPLLLAPEQDEFDYTIALPPWMEVGRTSRTSLMAIGVIEEDGVEHRVSYSSTAQHDQIIVLVDPERLSLEPLRPSVPIQLGELQTVQFLIRRDKGLSQPVTVDLALPDHLQGVRAEPVVLDPDATRGALTLEFAESAIGPLNQPVTLRATTLDERGLPVTAEAELELVRTE